MALKLRRGTEAERVTAFVDIGEIVYVTDTKKVFVGDGATTGGILVGPVDTALFDVLSDTTPQLGGNLDLNGNNITGTGNISITGNITATGTINLGDGVEDNITVGGLINSSLNPAIDDTYNLGTSANQWRNVWATQVNVDTTLAVGSQIIKLSNGSADSNLVLWDAETDTVTAKEFVGDIKGSVFADDSSVLVDAISGVFYGTVDTGDVVLNQSSIIAVNDNLDIGTIQSPLSLALNLDSNLQIRQVINPLGGSGFITSIQGRGSIQSPAAAQANDELGGLLIRAYTDSSTAAFAGIIGVIVDPTAVIAGGNFIKSQVIISAASDTSQDPEDALILDSAGVATSNAFVANKFMQLPVYADDTARGVAIPTPAKGMMVFMTSGTAPTVTNKPVIYNGTAWEAF
jgi:hypothetical protein